MSIPVDLWTPVAALLGLRPDTPFPGGIWYGMAKLTLPCGFVCHSWVWLWILSAAVVALFWRYVRTRKDAWLYSGLALAGVLTADSPWVLLLVAWLGVIAAIWLRYKRAWNEGEVMNDPLLAARIKKCLATFFAGLVPLVALNLWLFGLVAYARGYVHNAVAAVVPDGPVLYDAGQNRAEAVIRQYLAEVAGAVMPDETLFTDGTCDDGLRLAGVTNLVPVVNGSESDLAWYRAGLDGEYLAAFEISPVVFVKTLVEKRDPRLWTSKFLFDMGGDGVKYPRLALEALAESILEFYRLDGHVQGLGEDLRRKFVSVHWRVSRLLRHRAAELDRNGDAKGGMKFVAIADRLDTADDSMRRRFRDLDHQALAAFAAATPREGFEFALKRANFPLAHRLAKPILESDPDDPEANFAAAMDYCAVRSYSLAEEHLRRALKRRPEEPAILNNLAMVLMQLNRHEEALPYAEKALKKLPNSPEIQRTVSDIRARRK